MKRVIIAIAVLAAIAVVAGLVTFKKMQSFMNAEMSVPDAGMAFEIEPGSSFSSISRQLVDSALIDNDHWLRLNVRIKKMGGSIQAGDYWIEPGATPASVLAQFTNGIVRQYSFTIIEGWNHRELLAALRSNEAINVTMSDEDWPALLDDLGAETTHPEGLFLPETYKFPKNTTDKVLLRQAYEAMHSVLQDNWAQRTEASLVQSPYEALILASIVEKETARVDERPVIAGVFTRRLKLGMRLQTDPTVIYGLGAAFDGNLTRKHLTTDTPYNTYTRSGLPPTPIAMPGAAAIAAALNPADGIALYFVATGLSDGSHKFSTTKAEHDAAVAEYLARLRQYRRSGQ